MQAHGCYSADSNEAHTEVSKVPDFIQDFQRVNQPRQAHLTRTSLGCNCSSEQIYSSQTILYQFYCLDDRLGDLQDKSACNSSNSPPPYFQLLERFPRFRPCYGHAQLRIHPTMICPKPPFVSQPSNVFRRYLTHRQAPFKADNANWSY